MLVLRCTYRRADDKAMKRTRHARPERRSCVLQGRCRMQRSDREARAREDAGGFKIWGRGGVGLPDVALARGAGRLAPVLLGRRRSGIRYCVAGSMARTGGDRNLRPLERGLLPLQRAGAARPSREPTSQCRARPVPPQPPASDGQGRCRTPGQLSARLAAAGGAPGACAARPSGSGHAPVTGGADNSRLAISPRSRQVSARAE